MRQEKGLGCFLELRDSTSTNTSLMWWNVAICGAVLFAPSIATANVPLMPVVFLIGFPLVISVGSLGAGFVAIMAIEAFVLRRRLGIQSRSALVASGLANAASTLVGVWGVVTYSAGELMLVGLPVMALVMARVLRSFVTRTAQLQWLGDRFFMSAILFAGMGFLAAFLGALTIPGHTYIPTRLEFSGLPELALAIAGAVLLLAIGFLLSCLIEAVVVAQRFPEHARSIPGAVLMMNLCSYLVLVAGTATFAGRIAEQKSWFWHPPESFVKGVEGETGRFLGESHRQH